VLPNPPAGGEGAKPRGQKHHKNHNHSLPAEVVILKGHPQRQIGLFRISVFLTIQVIFNTKYGKYSTLLAEYQQNRANLKN
jgi:hypothetical protein